MLIPVNGQELDLSNPGFDTLLGQDINSTFGVSASDGLITTIPGTLLPPSQMKYLIRVPRQIRPILFFPLALRVARRAQLRMHSESQDPSSSTTSLTTYLPVRTPSQF